MLTKIPTETFVSEAAAEANHFGVMQVRNFHGTMTTKRTQLKHNVVGVT